MASEVTGCFEDSKYQIEGVVSGDCHNIRRARIEREAADYIEGRMI
jgi:hypothetical protein